MMADQKGLISGGGGSVQEKQAINNALQQQQQQHQEQSIGSKQQLTMIISNGQTKPASNQTNSSSFKRNQNGKLGSDGESDAASPESSLSPVDVDSLEGKNLSSFLSCPLFLSFSLAIEQVYDTT